MYPRKTNQELMADDQESLVAGLKGILGDKTAYPDPEPYTEPCKVHTPDHHIYDNPDDPHPVFMTMRCTRCGQHYTISRNSGEQIEGM